MHGLKANWTYKTKLIIAVSIVVILSNGISITNAHCHKKLRTFSKTDTRLQQKPEINQKLTRVKRQTPYTIASLTSSSVGNSTMNQLNDEQNLNQIRLDYLKFKLLTHLGMSNVPKAGRISKQTGQFVEEAVMNMTKSLVDGTISPKKYRRAPTINCNPDKNDMNLCCRENFYVNFTEFGWDNWILFPPGYHAYYCRGQCDLSNFRYPHTTIMTKYNNHIGLCCSPRAMRSLQILYLKEGDAYQSEMPEMIVDRCDCV